MEYKLLACPACGANLDGVASETVECGGCGRVLVREAGGYRAKSGGNGGGAGPASNPGVQAALDPKRVDIHALLHHEDYVGAKVGMWLFLFTELLLFGGMFLVYSLYRAKFSKEFHAAALELNTGIGALNTLLLLTSSLTVALAIAAIQKGKRGLCLLLLWATIAQGLGFMVNKYFEWSYKFGHKIYPGSLEMEQSRTEGEIIFYNLYFVMTGLHGLHVLIGLVCLGFCVVWIMKNWVRKDDFVVLENSGLYWHLVDLIWIYLFPLFYLIS